MDTISTGSWPQSHLQTRKSPIPLSIQAGPIALSAAAHLPAVVPAPVVVCSHGLFSAKQSPKLIAVCEALSQAGFCAIRFDFSGCGNSAARIKSGLIDQRRQDLASVIDFARKQPWWDGRPVGLFGSSLGGFLSLLAANEHPQLIGPVVSWSAPFTLGSKHPVEIEPANFPEGIGCPTDLCGLDQVRTVLLIHGQCDELVPWAEAVQIYKRLKDPKKLIVFRSADHRISDPSWRNTAIGQTVDWFSCEQ
ncbi:MAG: alpha/beta hydrolase family protein [Syntrophobacteraceae bacterium]